MNILKKLRATAAVMAAMGIGAASPGIISAATDAEEDIKAESLVVTATRNEMDSRDAPGAISIISRQDIEEAHAGDLVDLLRDQAGIVLMGRSVGGRETIAFRGLNDKHTLIMVNGMRISASNASIGHSDLENNWVPMENIERIEIVRGPLSALYGSEAMGGVINIITRSAENKWSGSVQTRGGVLTDRSGGETMGVGTRLSGPLVKDKLTMNLSAEYSKEDPTALETDDKITEIEGKKVTTGSVDLTFTPSDDYSLNLFMNATDEEREVWNVSSSKGYYKDIYKIKKYQVGGSLKADVGSFDNQFKVYRSLVEKDRPRTYDSGETADSYDEIINDVADLQSTFTLLGTRMTLGGEARNEELSSQTMVNDSDDALHTALFVQDELVLFDRLSLTAGLRWDHHEAFGSEASPRIYALYKWTDSINFKAGYGHAFNAPTVKQVSADYHGNSGRHEFYGNPDLKPETADNFELGLEFYGDRLKAKCFYFYNEIDDLIDTEQIGTNGSSRIYTYENIAEARTQGLETEVEIALGYGFDLGGSYTYMDAKDTLNDSPLEGRPRHTAGGKLRYGFEPWGLWAALRCDYTGEQLLDEEDAPAFVLWHFSLGKKLTDSLEIKFGVDNIGDVRLADKSEAFSYEERGRTVWAGLTARF